MTSIYSPYAFSYFFGESPYYSPSLVLVSFLKVGIPPLKINIFQRLKYR